MTDTKFVHGQSVCVVKGFFRGNIGRVTDYSENDDTYFVEGWGLREWISSGNLDAD